MHDALAADRHVAEFQTSLNAGPLQQAFYAPPFLDMHNRMKEALVMLGQFRSATVRPPLLKLDANEIERVRAALTDSGLLNAEARSQWNRSASDR